MLNRPDPIENRYARAVPRTPLRRMLEDFLLALTLLTRIPVPHFEIETKANHGTAFWAYPIVGAIVGSIGAAAFAVAQSVGLTGFPAVILALAAMVLTTGAFHEDGFADFCDGVGGGQTPEQKLEIMRDSRLGTYGAMGLIFLVGLTMALLANLYANLQHFYSSTNYGMACILISTSAFQRAAIGLPLMLLFPARPTGLAADTPTPSFASFAVGIAFAFVLGVILLGAYNALCALLAAFAAATVAVVLSAYYLGGRTGDALGATASLAGLFVLAVLSALFVHLQ